MPHRERLLAQAALLTNAGEPVPVDLEAALAAEGVALDNIPVNEEENG